MGNSWSGQGWRMDRAHSHTLRRLACALLTLLLLASAVPYARGEDGYPDGPYMVEGIVDGDTFIISGGKRVRLIGIDAPDHGEFCSEQASQRLTSLILGKTVLLERDITDRDEEDRLLRYAFIGETLVKEHEWAPIEGDLSDFAGKTVRIKLISDVGKNDNSTGDWACWAEMRIETVSPSLIRILDEGL